MEIGKWFKHLIDGAFTDYDDGAEGWLSVTLDADILTVEWDSDSDLAEDATEKYRVLRIPD